MANVPTSLTQSTADLELYADLCAEGEIECENWFKNMAKKMGGEIKKQGKSALESLANKATTHVQGAFK